MSSKDQIRTIFNIGDPHEFTELLKVKFNENSPSGRIDQLVHGDWLEFYKPSYKQLMKDNDEKVSDESKIDNKGYQRYRTKGEKSKL